jgi:CHASE2 domain-containing sensor protein
MTRPSTDWTKHIFKWLLFVVWPLVACLLLVVCALMFVAAWFLIPFGKPVMENLTWTLKFPWGKS